MQIELKNVNFIYNKDSAEQVEALSDINLTFGGDSFIAIIGSTGSGKSTLIQLLNALQKPTEGTIL
ncbi:MAG: ATP-binding cassette domain-containing protein, partial [Lachnospiraceae bacterium]|nr:ATP-binding cassette domain-containing protein [Lachnospiraceae bacterium]